MKTLFDETSIGTMQAQNRLVRSATWEAMADDAGRPTPRLINLYRELAAGGVGLVITSATMIAPGATLLPGMFALNGDSSIAAFRALSAAVHDNGSPVVMQLTHVGTNGTWLTPGSTSKEDLHHIVCLFGDAASRAQQAGFDGVQIHSGHGYFISQFLSAKKNTRTDEYGGTAENRTRFLAEITGRSGPGREGLLHPCQDQLLGFRWGRRCLGCLPVCVPHPYRTGYQRHRDHGGRQRYPLSPAGLPYEESVFRDYAAEIANTVSIPVILVGLNRTPAVMTELLNTTGIAYFSLSRPFLRQPDLASFWKNNPGQPAACISCDACRKQPDGNVCPFRDDPVAGK